jgi:hypothetical protein
LARRLAAQDRRLIRDIENRHRRERQHERSRRVTRRVYYRLENDLDRQSAVARVWRSVWINAAHR